MKSLIIPSKILSYKNVRKFANEEYKLKSIMHGTGMQRAQTAFELCGAFAKSGGEVLKWERGLKPLS